MSIPQSIVDILGNVDSQSVLSAFINGQLPIELVVDCAAAGCADIVQCVELPDDVFARTVIAAVGKPETLAAVLSTRAQLPIIRPCPALCAIDENSIECVRLLAVHMQLDATHLSYAIENSRWEIAKIIIGYYPELISKVDLAGSAARENNIEMMNYALAVGAEFCADSLADACLSGATDAVTMMLDLGLPVTDKVVFSSARHEKILEAVLAASKFEPAELSRIREYFEKYALPVPANVIF